MGICYEEGNGVAMDLGISKEYYRRASVSNNPSAISNYAYLLYSERNYREALQQFNIAHSYGCPDAAYRLGMIYEKGCDDLKGFKLEGDLCMALLYYNEAIEKVIINLT